MSSLQTPVILYDASGNPISTTPGSAAPGSAIQIGGTDGSALRALSTDSSGHPVIVGSGTAGSPSGGVVSIQGVTSGTAIPVSGSITATNPSVGTDNSAKPSSDTLIGGSDGTNVQAARIFDSDSGAGTQWVLGVQLRQSASGGSVELGTSSYPINTISVCGTTSCTNVSGSASSVTLLAANSSRKGATITNDSVAVLYLKLGTTASITSFTIALNRYDYYELPFGYTGRIDGIWSAATGVARITELTA